LSSTCTTSITGPSAGSSAAGAKVVIAKVGVVAIELIRVGRRWLCQVSIAGIPFARWPTQIAAERGCLGFLLCACLRACTPRYIRLLALGAPPAARDGAVIEPDGIAERVELQLRQLASVADAELVKRQVRERHPLELVDLVAERLDHPMDLAMLAFMDRDAEPRVLALAGKDLDLGRHRGGAIIERDAIPQRLDVLALELAVNLDVIRLGDVIAGREQPCRELAIVGQEQHAFGVEVEAADRLYRDRQVR